MKKLVLVLVLLVASVGISAQSVTSHTVQRGESIESIAQKYGISVSDLISANPDAKDYFFVGMKLTIPAKSNIVSQPDDQTKEPTNVNVNKYDNNSVSAVNNDLSSFVNFSFKYQPDSKMYGLEGSINDNNLFFFCEYVSNLKTDFEASAMRLGFGVGPLIKLSGDNLVLGINIAPYLGFKRGAEVSISEKGISTEEKTKFSYGAMGQLMIAVKLFKTKKGKNGYFTGGYRIEAEEFKTKDMFKYGYWTFGYAQTF